jgi:hypothetical protein
MNRFDLQNLLEEKASQCVARHNLYLKPYACGRSIDPLFWCFWRLFDSIPEWKYFLVLHNWWDDTWVVDNPGTVEDNADHALQCMNHDDGTVKTLPKLFHTAGSEPLLRKGICLPLNAIWGAPSEEGYKKESFPAQVYLDFMDVWVWLANELKPQCIYLLGGWVWPGLLRALRERTTVGYKLLPHPGSKEWRGIVVVDELITTLMNRDVR